MLGDKNDIVGEIDFDYMFKKKQYLLQVTHTINEKDYKREIENLKDLPSSFIKQSLFNFFFFLFFLIFFNFFKYFF